MYVILVLSHENLATFRMGRSSNVVEEYTQKLDNCMRNEQFATARQSLYGQIQLGERVFPPTNSRRRWNDSVLHGLARVSGHAPYLTARWTSAPHLLWVHKWEISTMSNWIWQHGLKIGPSASTLRRQVLLHTLQRVDNVIPFQLQAEDLGLMTCCGVLLRSCDRGTYCTLENLVWQRL